MCMMIWHPIDCQPLTRPEFEDFNARNPHGFGVIWRTPRTGHISYRKGRLNVAQQWKLYQSLLYRECEEMVLHWRYATAGALRDANCHPFEATGDVLVAHNGVLSHRQTRDLSDTQCFIADVLRPALIRNPVTAYNPRWANTMAARIGYGNKLVIWHRDEPEPAIIGEHRGVWYKDRWYSNTYAWTIPAEVRAETRARSLAMGQWV